jgi:hypothetical protein
MVIVNFLAFSFQINEVSVGLFRPLQLVFQGLIKTD